MMYAVTSHRMHHLPGIRYDAFDVTSRATSVGRKLATDVFQQITAKPEAGKDCNQGQRPWLPQHRYIWCNKVGAYCLTVTHVSSVSVKVCLCPGEGSLSKGVSVQGISVGKSHPGIRKEDDMHPTGMHSCYLSVCPQEGGSASVHAGIPYTPVGADTPGIRHPRDQTPHPPADGYCCGQYASYWNAFLLEICCLSFCFIF